ncbi:MAG: prepilin-type N-terminal cleavage/methylation domain-containing protein [Armatimonadetes bacterium]|nr:prepilin-type N-terminal cleavage/methylation domain-containing protein [Armatimonadota bacterium]
MQMNIPCRKAFTLIELLIVIGIVVIIAALLFPLFSAAKRKAMETQELNQLRQWAVAHESYLADFDDKLPGDTIPLVRGGYAPASLCALPWDPFPEGWANSNRHDGIAPKTPYKDSFMPLRLAAGRQFFEAFRQSNNGGWLISASHDSSYDAGDVVLKKSKYRRLTFGGSIIHRRFNVVAYRGDEAVFMDQHFSDDQVIPLPE